MNPLRIAGFLAVLAMGPILGACSLPGALAAIAPLESVVAAEAGYAETPGGHDGYFVQGLQKGPGRWLCGEDAVFDENGNCGSGNLADLF